MTGVYRPRHPERTALYRVLFHYFDRFLSEYESRFQREYGFFRPIIKEVVEGHHEARRAVVISQCFAYGMRLPRRFAPRNDASTAAIRAAGFARIRCPDCGEERLAELFAREVLADLVRKELLSPEWGERIHAFRHTGFNVHSLVRAKTSVEAERVGKYMIRPVLSLERLSLDEREGKVC